MIEQGADNLHLAILGRSGSGKSYFLRGLIEQAAQQGALCMVLDCSTDFQKYSSPNDTPFQRINVTDPAFTINPLATEVAKGGLVAAQQLLSAIHSAFHMGNRATVALQKATMGYFQQSPHPTLPDLIRYINGQKKSVGLATAFEPLELLSTLVHCGDQPINLDLTESGIFALGFDEIVDTKLRVLLVELVLQSVWTQWVSIEHDADHPLIVVLDECQNLSWEEGSMAVRILREGRKFGIGGWFASQWVSGKTAISALGQAAFQANFRPDDNNIPALAKKLAQSGGSAPEWQKLIRSMKVGQFLHSRRDGRTILVNVSKRQVT